MTTKKPIKKKAVPGSTKAPAPVNEAPLAGAGGNMLRVFTEQDGNGQWIAGVTLGSFTSKDIALANSVAMQKAIHEAIMYDVALAQRKNLN